MAFKKGAAKPKASGRKPGTPNKRTRVLDACTKMGADPFEFLASVMVDLAADMRDRLMCAKELAEYLEPKRSRQEITAEIEHTTEEGNPYAKLTRDQARQVLDALDAAAQGKGTLTIAPLPEKPAKRGRG